MGSLTKGLFLVRGVTRVLPRCPCRAGITASVQEFHTSQISMDDFDDYVSKLSKSKMTPPKKFLTYNDVVYPPTKEGEEIRPAEYVHVKKVPGSPKKFWFAAVMVRGLSIDEAIRQCEFSKKAYPKIIQEVLIEARRKMLKECNVEFASNMWIADSFTTKGGYIRTIRRGAKSRVSTISHPITNYFVRLREGQPPEHYYPPEDTGYEKLEEYIKRQRLRRIKNSL